MRLSEKMRAAPHLAKSASHRVENMFFILSFLGFVSIATVYLMLN